MDHRRLGILKIVARILLFALAAAASGVAQTTINVPTDVATIQAAINAANNGDTVAVAPGTYFENINFQGKAITVVSVNGSANTIIDGGGTSTVVTFSQGETTSAVLSGFTIRNGKSAFSGAGIEIKNASPTIQGNVITGNQAVYGVGIDISSGSPVIQNNVITNNHQCCGTSGSGGGGISVAGGSTTPANPQIVGNTITNNSLANGGFGGGIDVTYFSSPLIQNNIISGNSVYNYGGGINVSSYNQALVVQNIITNNSAGGGGSGGGVSYYAFGGNSLFLNNTVYGNHAYDGSSEIYLFAYPSAVTLSNNAVLATTGNALTCASSVQPTVSHNIIYDPNGVAFAGSCSAMAGTNGNVSADPLFVNAAGGDFHLQANSPAIDAGDNSPVNLPTKDFAGNPRIVDGNGDGNAVVDMGVYELPAPQLLVSTSSVSFGPQLVGTTSAIQSVTISNSGDAPLSITSISVGVPFAQTNNCPGSLAPGNACSTNLTFSPGARGAASGNLAVNVAAPAISQTVALAGTGVAPILTASPSSLSFGSVLVGTTSASQAVVFSNTGDATLSITGLNVVGSVLFATNGNCGSSLAPGASCTINVTFQPAALGAASGSLVMSVAAPASSQTVSLTGTGVAPAASLSPNTLTFASQLVGTRSAAQIVTLTNSGTASLTINSATLTGPFAQTTTCGSSLAAGASCTFSLTFTPTARGIATGALTITHNAPGSPSTVALSGTGVQPVLTVSPNSLSFGSVLFGTTSGSQVVTVSNSGDAALLLSSISAGAPFAQTNNCPASLAPGNSCTINVTFSPTTRGAVSANLAVNAAAPASSQTVALSGTGIGPAASLSPAALDFGSQPLNVNSGKQTVVLSNPGEMTLKISAITISSGDYSLSKNCGGSLAPGASCQIQVAFKPTALGLRTGAVTITDNAAGGAQTLPLSGYGVDFSVAANPSSVSTVRGSAANITVALTPLGGAYPNAVTLSCSGLPGGSSCAFTPNPATPGSAGATVNLLIATSSNTGVGTYKVTVKGVSGSQQHTAVVTLTVTKN